MHQKLKLSTMYPQLQPIVRYSSSKLLSPAVRFIFTGVRLTSRQRGTRLVLGLVQPLLSITDVLGRNWEIVFSLVSVFMVVTSVTGICFAEKLLPGFRRKEQKNDEQLSV